MKNICYEGLYYEGPGLHYELRKRDLAVDTFFMSHEWVTITAADYSPDVRCAQSITFDSGLRGTARDVGASDDDLARRPECELATAWPSFIDGRPRPHVRDWLEH